MKIAAGTWDLGVSSSSGDGGEAHNATLAFPKGIAVDESNIFYVTEFQGYKVRAVTTDDKIFTCIGTGEKVFYSECFYENTDEKQGFSDQGNLAGDGGGREWGGDGDGSG